MQSVIYDACPALSIFDLIKAGCFDQEGTTNVTIPYSVAFEILLQICIRKDASFITVSHTEEGRQITNDIQLLKVASGLGNGVVWFFICPVTGIRCRKLLFHNGYLQHRSAIKGLYKTQTNTPSIRQFMHDLKTIQTLTQISEKLTTPYFRKTYAGLPTKPYTKILRKITST